jgi:transcriptional regulator with XRE-family HTH domain
MRATNNRIRQARRSAKLSQAKLAERVGVHRSAVAQWEDAGGCHPTIEHCARLALATEVSFEWLVTGRGRMRYQSDLLGTEETPAVLLNFCAQSEVEERVLMVLRKLETHAQLAVLQMMENLVRPPTIKANRRTAYSR